MKNTLKTTLFFFLITISLPNLLHAQRAQTLYVEGLGNALVYSLNYDTRFLEGTDKWGARIGVGVYKEVIGNVLQLNYLIGANSHKFEVGAGISTQIGFGGEKDRRQVTPNAALMYRYQNLDGNFLFRIGLGSIFLLGEDDSIITKRIFWFWPGLSLGYAF